MINVLGAGAGLAANEAMTRGVDGYFQTATNVDPGLSALVMPNPITSATWGILSTRQRYGLTSGGLVGYKTLFTGTRGATGPMDRAFRAMSVGNIVNKAVARAANYAMRSGKFRNEAVISALERMSLMGEHGLAGAFTAQKMGAMQLSHTALQPKYIPHSYALARPRISTSAPVMGRISLKPPRPHSQRVVNAIIDPQALSARVADKAKWLFGVGGGVGFRNGSELALDWTIQGGVGPRGSRYAVATASKGTSGAAFAGRAGRIAGSAMNTVFWAELAGHAILKGVDMVGSGFKHIAQLQQTVTEQIGQGSSTKISAGYFNEAASTERRRAMQNLNSSMLNPRNQLMGNEAYFMS